ncbi:SDR family NAD(P)-dependent oxidoreductase [Oerskovia sp. M15]
MQISTVGAIGSMPTFGLYNAGKWALEGFSEALSAEVAQFKIHVTVAQLGGFATDWAGSSMSFAPRNRSTTISAMPCSALRRSLAAADPHAPSTEADPRIAADALVAHLSDPDRPLRVLIGDDAREQAAQAYAARRDSYGQGRDFSWPS